MVESTTLPGRNFVLKTKPRKTKSKNKVQTLQWIFMLCISVGVLQIYFLRPMDIQFTGMETMMHESFTSPVSDSTPSIRGGAAPSIPASPSSETKVITSDRKNDNVPKSQSPQSNDVTDTKNNNSQASPALESNDITEWKNDNDIVHIIYSRFMQHQPNLLELGKARLELFKTFCLNTIAQQTNKQFLWIIRADPDLHPTLREGLLQAIGDIPNIVVVGSNEIRKGSLNGGFRSPDAISDITEESLFYGNLRLIQSFHAATKGRTLLETNLDADDGLGLTFVETAQRETKSKFDKIPEQNGWMNLCVGRHLEWQYYAPWDKQTDKGSLHLGSTHICVTPGLSWATQPNATPNFTVQHHLIKKKTKGCHEVNNPYLGCWYELPVANADQDVMAIRARTPTSTGMNAVVMEDHNWDKRQARTDKASWPLLNPSFAISLPNVQESHKYLSNHLTELVKENLEGQCTKDHSCSEGIKKKLKSLFFARGKWQNRHDLVHVVHTSLHDPKMLDMWQYFPFNSLQAQTTYEFLWIIRLHRKGFSNRKALGKLRKVIKKSPLNIIVVMSDEIPKADFRDQQAISDINENTIQFGNYSMLEDFHKAAQNRTLLETSIGPTDAIKKTFIADIQNSVEMDLNGTHIQVKEDSWYYECVSEYIAWQYFTPEMDVPKNGLGFVHEVHSKPLDNCLNHPATTRISLPGAHIPHHTNQTEVKLCPVDEQRQMSNDGQWACFKSITGQSQAAHGIFPKSIDTPVFQALGEATIKEQANEKQQRNIRSQLVELDINQYHLREMTKKLRDSN